MTMSKHPLIRFLAGLVLLWIVGSLAFLFVGWPSKTPHAEFGMTYSVPYSQELGLDPDYVLKTALDEVNIRRFRIAAYRNRLEPNRGEWHWEELDHIIDEIGKRHGKVILAAGEKLPRWPECWSPQWWKKLPRVEQEQETLHYLETVVTRYRNNPTIAGWQVENEPHFYYGDCPKPDYLFIQKETAFVRGLDPTRPITTTDSGELSSWLTLGPFVDRLGVSVYRTVRNPLLGDLNWHYWFLPPYFYARKAMLARPLGLAGIYVSEFQMEPWSNKSLPETSVADQLTSMNVDQMHRNFEFATRMGITPVDFWGIEWWLWMRDKAGHPEFMDEAKRFWAEAAKDAH